MQSITEKNPQAVFWVMWHGYIYGGAPSSCIFRSYHTEYSDTHQNIELKQCWAGLVLG